MRHDSRKTSPVHPAIIYGDLCGVVCDFCPLRSHKSMSGTVIHCSELLKVIRLSNCYEQNHSLPQEADNVRF